VEQSIIESVQGAIETDEEKQGYFQAYDDIDQLRWNPQTAQGIAFLYFVLNCCCHI